MGSVNMKAKIGQLRTVLNNSRVRNQSKTYQAVWVEDSGRPIPMLMTDHELYELKERAEDHKEDMPALQIPIPEPKRKSFFNRFFRSSRQ